MASLWYRRREGTGAMEEITDESGSPAGSSLTATACRSRRLPDGVLKGTGPPYAKFGRHVRYRLRDVVGFRGKATRRTQPQLRIRCAFCSDAVTDTLC